MEGLIHTCVVCQATFPSRDSLMDHYSNHNPPIRFFVCDVCNKGFFTESELNHHTRYHDTETKQLVCVEKGEIIYSCGICSAVFPARINLFEHYANHNPPIRYFVCEMCSQGYFTQRELNGHLKTHKNQKLYTCSICNAEFKRETTMKRHQTISHRGQHTFTCNECGEIFLSKEAIDIHYLSHTEQKPFLCEVCAAVFESADEFKTHKDSHKRANNTESKAQKGRKTRRMDNTEESGENPEMDDKTKSSESHKFAGNSVDCGKNRENGEENDSDTFNTNENTENKKYNEDFGTDCGYIEGCDICFKVFKSKYKLTNHIKQHKPLKCSFCSIILPNRISYINHCISHDPYKCFKDLSYMQKVHVCRICGKEFKTRFKQSQHMERCHALCCNICGKTFKQVARYIIHLENHLKDNRATKDAHKMFSCKICYKAFSSQDKLKSHMNKHDPNKPFGCKVCGKHFDDEKFFNTHKALHERRIHQECDVCGKLFKERLFFDIHRLTHFDRKPLRCDTCEDIFLDNTAYLKHQSYHKAHKQKHAKRFLTMREVLKQKLEESSS